MISRLSAGLVCALIVAACNPTATTPGQEDSTAPTSETATSFESTGESDPAPPNPGVRALVTYVSDGDSLVVEVDGTEERVRLIGINTPEKDECYGSEARDIMVTLLDGQEVLLVTDVEDFDQYGRLLSYVYLGDVLINAEMARLGAAITRPYSPNTTLQGFLADAQAAAEDQETGMWGACAGDDDPEVLILSVQADAPGRDDENLNGEFIILENQTSSAIDMSGWILRDESSTHRFTFPDGSQIADGAFIVVLTGCGTTTDDEFYWCNTSPVWDNAGDTAFLLDHDGNIHHRFGY